MDQHRVRNQPARILFLVMIGASCLLLLINQSDVHVPFLNRFPLHKLRLPSLTQARQIQDNEASVNGDMGGSSAFRTQNGVAKGEEIMDANATGDDQKLQGALEEHATAQNMKDVNNRDSLEEKVNAVLNRERAIIQESMQGYTLHQALNATHLDDLVLEKGGQPVRSLIITTWRSGSTFIGDVLQSHPATFYHYEPLLDFGIVQVRHGESARQALHNLHHLLNCNYDEMDHYLKFGQDHQWLFNHNNRLWPYCVAFPDICWNPKFLTPFCKLFPFQSLKTVRLRLNLTTEFLQNEKLGVQVLLLVRDPRGTVQSRHHRIWCPGNPDCDDPEWLCHDLVSDYYTAKKFAKLFPNSFRVIRYEDLSFDAYNMTRELFEFFHLSYHPKVEKFLDTHTKKKIGGVSSTFRNSKVAPVHWQNDLPWEEVKRIQSVCGTALNLWGYRIAEDEKHLRSFNPVGKLETLL